MKFIYKLIVLLFLISFIIGCANFVKVNELTTRTTYGISMSFQLPRQKNWYKLTDPILHNHNTYISGDSKNKYAIIIETNSFEGFMQTEEDLIKRGDEIQENQKGILTARDTDYKYSSESFIYNDKLCVKYNVEFISTSDPFYNTYFLYWDPKEYLDLDPSPSYFYEYIMFPCIKKDSSLLRSFFSSPVNTIYLHKSTTVNRDPNLETEALELIKSAK